MTDETRMTKSTHPTAGWERVGDRFYRKTQLYTAVFDLDLDLDNYLVAGAPYGGAVGMSTPSLSLLVASPMDASWLTRMLLIWGVVEDLHEITQYKHVNTG